MPMMSVSLLVLMVAGIHANPVDRLSDNDINKIDYEMQSDMMSMDQDPNVLPALNTVTTENPEGSTTAKPGLFSWFLTPLTQNLQFSPQSFLHDRIVGLKETLNNLGVQVRGNQNEGKQLSNGNGLLQLVATDDSGFHTDRTEPAGFFGGNGWLANKGGLLGGPGAILSTGSVLTDYPTPYRRRK
ncbi:uncharacterized protein LOC143177265 [Calliopsis andreniformis]|uniref:uncharacterized protein LOC143177265 n=1 Tax=Calliopsis andreniformis TaxID=337506 RepID=UPI003FCE421B